MRIERYTVEMEYEYHEERKGSKYFFGGAYKNHGEFIESIMKHHRGLEYLVNPATKWNEGSDIEEEHMSVKSDKATLACVYGDTVEEILEIYFSEVTSTQFAWGYEKDGMMTEFIMDSKEFKEFCIKFGRLGVESFSKKVVQKKVRFNTTSKQMLDWFEEILK